MEDKTNLIILMPLIVALGSGLAFIAYKHPREFRTLADWLFALLICLFIGGIVWDTSNTTARVAVIESNAIASGKLITDLSAAIRAVSVPWWWGPRLSSSCRASRR